MTIAESLKTTWRDILYALRTMRKTPAFTATAVLTLALGIGGNAAMFTVIRAVLLKPLAYRNPDRLVYFSTDNPLSGQEGQFARQQLDYMRATARSFTAMGAFLGSPENMASGSGPPEALTGARISANFLDILGVKPLLGRGFLPEEDISGGPLVAMISEQLWRRRFGADQHITGKAAALNSKPYTIVGVLPGGFQFPFSGADVWVSRPWESSALPPRFWGILILSG